MKLFDPAGKEEEIAALSGKSDPRSSIDLLTTLPGLRENDLDIMGRAVTIARRLTRISAHHAS